MLAFKENSERHFKEPYGYLSHFEWGNSLVKWGKLSGDGECPVEKPGMRARGLPAVVMGARQVFEEILEDGRYTPESLSWMKALVKLGQTYVMLADEEATGAIGSPERMKAAKELYRRGVSALTEALERYPLKKLELERDVKPAFYEFLKGEETATTEGLAMAHLGLGEYRQALRYFQALRGMLEGVEPRGEKAESEGLSSRQKSLYFYTGLCYYRLGVAEVDPAKAGGHFRDALDIFSEARDKLLQEPESPWVRHGMALCYERLGDLEAAARSYRDAAWAYENVPEEALAPKELGRGFWLERNKTLREALEWKVRAGGDKGAM